MNKVKEITCCRECPFFVVDDDPDRGIGVCFDDYYCVHEDKVDQRINSVYGKVDTQVQDDCPLKKSAITYKIK